MSVTQMCLWPNCVCPKCLRPKKSGPKECGPSVIVAQMCHSRWGWAVDIFFRPPTLTAGNFKDVSFIDLKFLALKDLNSFQTLLKFQEASSILKVDFALSNRPHLHKAYLVTICRVLIMTVLPTLMSKSLHTVTS